MMRWTWQVLDLSKPVFDAALKGFNKLMAKGVLNKDSILTIATFRNHHVKKDCMC